MSTDKTTKVQISFTRVLSRYVRSTFFFKKLGIAHTNLFGAIHTVNPSDKPKYKKENTYLTTILIDYALALNDVYDFQKFASRSKDSTVQRDYKIRKRYMKKQEKKLSESNNSVINAYIDEQNSFENWVGSQSDNYWNEETVKQARELMNAIGIVAIYVLLTNQPQLFEVISTNNLKKTPYPSLLNKYKWIFIGNPSNEHHNAIAILWNLALSSQILDDIHDESIDRVCGIPSFATVIKKRNKKTQMQKLKKLSYAYLKKAKEFGYNPIRLHNIFFNKLFIFVKQFVFLISKSPKLIKLPLANKFLFLQEKWILKQKF